MFDHRYYVPVLRWKSSERHALCELAPDVRKRMTPIFEPVPYDLNKNKPGPSITEQVKQMAESWGYRNFFIDLALLGEAKAIHFLPVFIKEADARQLKAGIITGPNWPPQYQTVVKKILQQGEREFCFRVNAYELRRAGFAQALKNLLKQFGKQPAEVHLVVDFQSLGNPLPDIAIYTQAIPHLDDWLSFTVIAGAFPKDLSRIKAHTQHQLPRSEWLLWEKYAEATEGRVPTFGDYASYRDFVDLCERKEKEDGESVHIIADR